MNDTQDTVASEHMPCATVLTCKLLGQNRVDIVLNLTAAKQIGAEFHVGSARISVATAPEGLKPPEIHQIKGQTTSKTRHSSLAPR